MNPCWLCLIIILLFKCLSIVPSMIFPIFFPGSGVRLTGLFLLVFLHALSVNWNNIDKLPASRDLPRSPRALVDDREGLFHNICRLLQYPGMNPIMLSGLVNTQLIQPVLLQFQHPKFWVWEILCGKLCELGLYVKCCVASSKSNLCCQLQI